MSDRGYALVLMAASLLVLAPGLFWGAPTGKSIVGGLRILDGEMPYRDFWTMYAPGQFYLIAALFKVFGTHVLVQGTAAIVVVALGGTILFAILRRLGATRGVATTLAALYVGMRWETSPAIESYGPAMLLLLLGIDRLIAYSGGGPARHLVIAGTLYGAAACFKHDVAFHIALASCAALLVGWATAHARRPASWIRPFPAVAHVAAGAAIIVLPVAGLLAWSAGPDAWQDLFVFPATDFPLVMRESYPFLPPWYAVLRWLDKPRNIAVAWEAADAVANWAVCNIPQYAVLGAAAWLFLRRRVVPPAVLAAGTLFVTVIPLFWLSAHVQQNTHPTSMAIFVLSFGALVWRTAGEDGPRAVAWRRGLAAAFCLYAAMLLERPANLAYQAAYFWPRGRTLDSPIAAGVRVTGDMFDVYDPIVRFVREHVPPDEPIYSGVTRHDAIVASNQAFYYLAQRPVAVRYNELHPALADSPEVQREIIDSLESKSVRCVILWRLGWRDEVFDSIKENRRRKIPRLGAEILDDYLRREFVVLETHGEYLVCWRRDAAPPTRWQANSAR